MAAEETILETRLVAPPPREVALGRRFSVGGVLATTVSVWWKHVLAFTAMSFAVYAPFGVAVASLYGTVFQRPSRADEVAKLGIGMLGAWLLTVLLAVVQAGAVTYGTVRHLSGERARFGEMLRAGIRRGLPVVGVGILLWFAVMAGLVLLVVPGVVLLVATSVAIPAAVVERPGVVGAIRRSFALTRGRRWPLFAAGLSILVTVWVLVAVVQVGTAVAATALLPPPKAIFALFAASQLGNVFFSVLPLIGMSVAYHDLRVEKEGIDTAALARVFE
jgi:hypothetical protein